MIHLTITAAKKLGITGKKRPKANAAQHAAMDGLFAWKTSEAEFQKRVIELANLHHWKVAAFRKVRVRRANGSVYWETPVEADGSGFPDLVLVRRRVIWAELKTDSGRPSREQRDWLAALENAGQEAYLWRPAQWAVIENVLGGNE